jgi:hypothetical protein
MPGYSSSFRLSERCITGKVVIHGAELVLDCGEPLEVVADRKFVGQYNDQ